MPAPATIEEFLELARQSEAVESDDAQAYVDRLRAAAALPDAPRLLASNMVRDGLLTRFQAEQLLRGKVGRFVLGDYRVLERVGSGGMAAVYSGAHVRTGARVAIKVLPPAKSSDTSTRERFLREARALAALDHPNIVRSVSAGNADQLHYLVMEYIDGSSLQDIVVQQGPLDIGRAAHYLRQAALGLQHAHEAGLVHRDIKPANLLVDRQGTVKILDLGLARFFEDEEDSLTRDYDPTSVLGTADYLAPEQAEDSHSVDIRADIYGLGATFYFALTGRSPVGEGTAAQKLIWLQLKAAQPLRALRPEVPEKLAAIIAQMMAKKPGDRYATPGAVADALTPLTQEPVPPPPLSEMPLSAASAGQSTAKLAVVAIATLPDVDAPPAADSASAAALPVPVNGQAAGALLDKAAPQAPTAASGGLTPRRSRRAWLVAAGVLVLAGGAVALWWDPSATEPAPPRTEPLAARIDEPPSPIPLTPTAPVSAIPVGELRVFHLHDRRVDQVLFTADGRRALSVGSVDKTLKLWDVETGDVLRTLSGHSDTIHGASLSRDCKLALSCSADRTVRLWELATGKELHRFTDHQSKARCVAFAPDGRRAGSGGDDRLVLIWDIDQKKLLHTLSGHTSGVTGVVFSPDGRLVLSASGDKTIRVWDAQKGIELGRLQGHSQSIASLALSADGRQVLSSGKDNSVRLWDLASLRLVRQWPSGSTVGVRSVALSPDGRYALSGGSGSSAKATDASVRLWEVATGRELRQFTGHTSYVTSLAFAPDGRQALSSSDDGTIRLWGLGIESAGKPTAAVAVTPIGEVQRFVGHTESVTAVALSPDGSRVLTGSDDRTIRSWDAASGKELGQLKGHTASVQSLAFLPDGRRALSGGDTTLRLWDVETGEELRRFEGHTDQVRTLAVAADGKRAVSGGLDKTLRLWDLENGLLLRTLEGHTDLVNSVFLAADGRQALSGSADQTLRLWDVEAGKLLRTFQGHADFVWCVALSPDGKQALSASEDRTVRLWDTNNGKEVRRLETPADVIHGVAFTPSGQRVVGGGGRVVQLWEVKSGKEIRRFEGHTKNISGLALSFDGSHVLTGSWDGTARLWLLPK